MKKFMLVAPLALVLFVMAFAVASAGVDFEDPALCVDGQWLLINAAVPNSVSVTLPRDAHYGDQAAGGCRTASPNVPLITNVIRRGEGDHLQVQVLGAQASNPVTISYGREVQVKKNTGKLLTFNFELD